MLGVTLAILISILNNCKVLPNNLQMVTYITSFENRLESSLGHTLNFYLNFCKLSFQEYVYEGISHPVCYGDLVYKLIRVKCEANFVSSGSKIVKRIRRRN